MHPSMYHKLQPLKVTKPQLLDESPRNYEVTVFKAQIGALLYDTSYGKGSEVLY